MPCINTSCPDFLHISKFSYHIALHIHLKKKTVKPFEFFNVKFLYSFYSQEMTNNTRSTLFVKSCAVLIVKSCGKSIQQTGPPFYTLLNAVTAAQRWTEWMESIKCDKSGIQTDTSSSVSSMVHKVAILQTSQCFSLSYKEWDRTSFFEMRFKNSNDLPPVPLPFPHTILRYFYSYHLRLNIPFNGHKCKGIRMLVMLFLLQQCWR